MAVAPGGIGDHVFLDATGIAPAVFARRFPTVSAACALAGVNPTTDPIPVAPAAHYHCGGVLTDLDGRTTVPGLFAVGEVARTGLHGANRLASNSLLEGLVMGERAAAAVGADIALATARPAELILTPIPGADPGGRTQMQATMSRSAGIGRDLVGLLAAQATASRLASVPATSDDRWSVETANLTLAGAALLGAAEARSESRGCHVRNDHPERLPEWERSVLVRHVDGAVVTEVAELQSAWA
jgi:L-aspartate oxidase